MPRVGYRKRVKPKKGYKIYHFYFKLSHACWWSYHYKVRGNKRINPKKLIYREVEKEDICYYPYELSEDKMLGWVNISSERWNDIMETLKAREKERIRRLVEWAELLDQAKKV